MRSPTQHFLKIITTDSTFIVQVNMDSVEPTLHKMRSAVRYPRSAVRSVTQLLKSQNEGVIPSVGPTVSAFWVR